MRLKIYEALEPYVGDRVPLMDTGSIDENLFRREGVGRKLIVGARFEAHAIIPEGEDASPVMEQTRRMIADDIFGQLRSETLVALRHVMERDHYKAYYQLNRVIALMEGKDVPEQR